jgi:glucose 1-dehydrogenase
VKQFGTIDILEANPGCSATSRFRKTTVERWNTVISVNLTGQFLCNPKAVREFIRRGVVHAVSLAAQNIICMSSVHQKIPWSDANYVTSKGRIESLMESMAQELSPYRIRVNAIAPIRTGTNSPLEYRSRAGGALTPVPYGGIGEPEDIARTAEWLASDDSDYVVDTTLFVDGGMTPYPEFLTGG